MQIRRSGCLDWRDLTRALDYAATSAGTLKQRDAFVKPYQPLSSKTSERNPSPKWLIFGLFSLLVIVTGCTKAETPSSASYFQIPWPSGGGEYRIQNVPLQTFSTPERLSGSYARVLVDPYVSGQSLEGRSVGRFISVGGNVFVPADFTTLQATALYAHLEKLGDLDRRLGVADKINWPLTIGLNANVVDSRGALRNNALYDGRLDSLLVVPYVERRLPISLNAGVLAHEHFHKIFQALVMNRIRKVYQERAQKTGKPVGVSADCNWAEQEELPDVPDFSTPTPTQVRNSSLVPAAIYNDFLLRGMNEGLADFWGWVYSGDSSFIGRSLGEHESERRRLDVDSGQLPSPEILKFNLMRMDQGGNGEAMRISLAYDIGTYYARFLRGLALKISAGPEADMAARLEVAQALMDVLPELGESLEAQVKQDDFISPNAFLRPLYDKLPRVTVSVCDDLDKFEAPEGVGGVPPQSCQKAREVLEANQATKPTGKNAPKPVEKKTPLVPRQQT